VLLAVIGAVTGATMALGGEQTSVLDGLWRQLFARPTTVPYPPDNPPSPCRIALGEALFHDRRLSRDKTRACVSCHDPARAYTDGLPTAAARDGFALARNTPSLLDVAWSKALHWDGRATTLEEQVWLPITHAQELAGQWPRIAAALDADDEMREAFAAAFPESPVISADNLAKALAAYERTLLSPPTRFDAWVEGSDAALTPHERAGFQLFVGKAGCVGCHAGWRFSDNRFHDIGLAGTDGGRGSLADGVAGLPAFRTPGLRGLAFTAPYMHDGSKPTLASVIEHYSGGFETRPTLSSNLVRGLALDPTEKSQLVAFLLSLSPGASPESPRETSPHARQGPEDTRPRSLRQDCAPGKAADH